MAGTLVAVGAAFDGTYDRGHSFDSGDHKDFGGHYQNYDWLNPGGVVYSYNWSTPAHYPTYYYPTYHYTAPVVYPTYTYTYNPFVYNYDPWWATNVYGWTGATYYSSSSWTWSYPHDGFFF
jgi:hypothetical protein